MLTRSQTNLDKPVTSFQLEQSLGNLLYYSPHEQKLLAQRMDHTFGTRILDCLKVNREVGTHKTRVLWKALTKYHSLPLYQSFDRHRCRHDIDTSLGTSLHQASKHCPCPTSQ